MIVGNEISNMVGALIKQGKEMVDGFELGSGIICKAAACGGRLLTFKSASCKIS